MVKYTLMVEYLLKGNNYTQVATLCGCSRRTVSRVLKRIDYFGFSLESIKNIGEEELRYLLFPERKKQGDGYLIPDYKWEEFQMCKHGSSIRLCWRRYCKRAEKQNLTSSQRTLDTKTNVSLRLSNAKKQVAQKQKRRGHLWIPVLQSVK